MQDLCSEITIEAPAEKVWAVLTDFAAYPAWNPFLEQVSGAASPGARLTVRFHAPETRPTTLHPVVLRAEPDRELSWRGRLFLPGLLDAEHHLTIEPDGPNRVRFTQREHFAGVLLPLVGGTLRKTQRGFEAMNLALKDRVERATP